MSHQGISPARVAFTVAGVAMTIFTILHGTGAFAQATPPAPQVVGVTPPAALDRGPAEVTGFDRPTLDAFARATRTVSALRNEYSPRIAAANIAGRPEKAKALFDEMRARMHDAIDAAGLTIERYEAIAARAEQDNALRARIEAILTGATQAPEPGLGVQTPAPAGDADDAGTALADALSEIETLQRRLETERVRARTERAELKRAAAAETEALRAPLEAAIARLTDQLAARTLEGESRDAALEAAVARERAAAAAVRAQSEMALTRAKLEKAALHRDIGQVSRELAGAVAALAALEEDLSAEPDAAVVQPLTRLERVDRPVLLAGKLPTLARDLTAVQPREVLRARLEAEKVRNLTLRAAYTSERVGLRREVARIGRDLAATGDALAVLEGAGSSGYVVAPEGPPDAEEVAKQAVARVRHETLQLADPMYDEEDYASPAVVDPEMEPAPMVEPALAPVADTAVDPSPLPAAPVIVAPKVPPAPVVRNGSVLAGIRAYELKDYARAYAIWLRLAEAGGASAQFHLGALYFEGRGVDRNLGEAKRWLRRALEQGQERARFLLGRVEAQISNANG